MLCGTLSEFEQLVHGAKKKQSFCGIKEAARNSVTQFFMIKTILVSVGGDRLNSHSKSGAADPLGHS